LVLSIFGRVALFAPKKGPSRIAPMI